MKKLRRALLVLLVLLVIAWFTVPAIVENRLNKVLRPGPYHASPAAEALHKTLIVADLHADSLLWKRNLLERSSRGAVDVPRLGDANVAIQAFTLLPTSPPNLNIYRNPDAPTPI